MAGTPHLTPFQQFCNGLHGARYEFNETMDELLAFAEVMARKTNSVEMDDNGTFYVTAAGSLEQVLDVMRQQLEKLERIKYQKDNQR